MMEVPSSKDAIYVGPICHIQTAKNRFGPQAVASIQDFIGEGPVSAHEQVQVEEDGVQLGDDDDIPDIDGADIHAGYNIPSNPMTGSFAEVVSPLQIKDLNGPADFPRMARTRMNLTTLSQRYNLYFAAYRNQIHIFQPQNAPQILPPASLVISPPQTQGGKHLGGYLDPRIGHQVNHLITGYLGDLEVLFMAYDDGDVVAYYTHLFANALENGSRTLSGDFAPSAPHAALIKPFLIDNVGHSAWGIAIHEKSRLLAVGCNKHDVTVFALATQKDGPEQPDFMDVDSGPAVPETPGLQPEPPILWSGQTPMELEKHFRSRTRTWRIVLPLSSSGNNIPTVAFIDDEDGNADKVLAADISGNTWILDIWKIGGFPALLPPSLHMGNANLQRFTGWGAIVLPDSSFKWVRNSRIAMGLPTNDIIKVVGGRVRNVADVRLDITRSLHYLEDNTINTLESLKSRYGGRYVPKGHPHAATGPSGLESLVDEEGEQSFSDDGDGDDDEIFDDDDEDEDDGDEDDEVFNPLPLADDPTVAANPWRALSVGDGPAGAIIDLSEEELQGYQLSRVIVPALGQTPDVSNWKEYFQFMNQYVIRQSKIPPVDFHTAQFPTHMKTNYSILKVTCSDMELHSLDPRFANVFCRDVIVPSNRFSPPTPWDLHHRVSERITMMIHVPELYLVILGSLCGRVALVSLRKSRSRVDGHGIRRCVRVDLVLPRRSEDRKRPKAALHGIAFSPVHDHKARGVRLQRPARKATRYRLILHYLDHTILMYDISRKSPNDGWMAI